MSDPTNEDIIQAARHLLKQGKRAQARKLLARAVRHAPDDAQLWYWLAHTLENQEHAIDSLQRALKLDPQHEEARAYLNELQAPAGLSTGWFLEEEAGEASSEEEIAPVGRERVNHLDEPPLWTFFRDWENDVEEPLEDVGQTKVDPLPANPALESTRVTESVPPTATASYHDAPPSRVSEPMDPTPLSQPIWEQVDQELVGDEKPGEEPLLGRRRGRQDRAGRTLFRVVVLFLLAFLLAAVAWAVLNGDMLPLSGNVVP